MCRVTPIKEYPENVYYDLNLLKAATIFNQL